MISQYGNVSMEVIEELQRVAELMQDLNPDGMGCMLAELLSETVRVSESNIDEAIKTALRNTGLAE